MKIRTALKRIGLHKSELKWEGTYLFFSDRFKPISFRKEQDRILQYTRLYRYRFDIFSELTAISRLLQKSPRESVDYFLDDVYNCFYIPVKYKIQYSQEWKEHIEGSGSESIEEKV